MIGNLFVEYAGNQAACRSQKPPAKLRIYGHVIHILRDKHFFVCSSHSLTNGANIGACFFRTIGNTDAAGKVNKPYVNAKFSVKSHGQLKKNAGKPWIVILLTSIAGEKRVQSKHFYAAIAQDSKRFKKLCLSHAKLRIRGVSDDAVCGLKGASWIKPRTDAIRKYASKSIVKCIKHIAAGVKVDNGSLSGSSFKVFRRRVVG